jgi:hypothetical protein
MQQENILFFPNGLIPLIDHAVTLSDSQQPKFIRNSVKRELERSRFGAPTAV